MLLLDLPSFFAPLCKKFLSFFCFLAVFSFLHIPPFWRHGGKCRFLLFFFSFSSPSQPTDTYAFCASLCINLPFVLEPSTPVEHFIFCLFPHQRRNSTVVYNLLVLSLFFVLFSLALGLWWRRIFWRYTPRCFSLEYEDLSFEHSSFPVIISALVEQICGFLFKCLD
jgi:hypothetical protein